MINYWKDENEAAFKTHDEYTRRLHQEYLDHLHLVPKLNLNKVRQEAERKANEESLSLTVEGAVTDEAFPNAPENAILKAVDEREAIRLAQNQVESKRRIHHVVSLLGALMLSSGAAKLVGPKLGAILPVIPPTWLSISVMAGIICALTTVTGWHAAKMRQIMREQKLDVKEISELALIEPVLKIERKLTSAQMLQELKSFAHQRWSNKKIDDAQLEEKGILIGLAFIILLQLAINLFQFGNSFDGFLTGAFLSLFGGAVLVMNLLPLTGVSLDIPTIPDYSVYDPKEAELKHENRLKELKAQGLQLEQEQKQQRVETISAKVKETEEVEKERHEENSQDFSRRKEKLYYDLHVATGKWEALRGFTPPEVSHMSGLRKKIKPKIWGLYFFLGLSTLMATYPASIFSAELLDTGYQYMAVIGKTAPASWIIWILLMTGAEILLVSSLLKTHKLRYEQGVLLQNYDLNLRKKGMTYTILRQEDARRESKIPRAMLAGSFVILCVELVANLLYLQQNALEVSPLTIAISFVPFLLLVGSAVITAEQKYQLTFLDDALGHEEPSAAQSQAPDSHTARNSESRRQVELIENEIGPRPVTGKWKRKS